MNHEEIKNKRITNKTTRRNPEETGRKKGVKKMNMNHNRIPRTFKKIIADLLVDSTAGKPARYEIVKRGSDYIGTNLETGKIYGMFVSHLRNPDVFHIVNIIF